MGSPKEKKQRTKRIMFSEKIDDNINGYSIGLTFIAVALFLMWKQEYLLSEIATQIVATIIGLFGIGVCSVQLGKSTTIKGFDDFGIGLLFFLTWLICYVKLNWFFINLLGLAALIFGTYGITKGIIEICYSVVTNIIINSVEKPKTTRIKEVFLLITQFFGLILTVLNILKIFGLVGAK